MTNVNVQFPNDMEKIVYGRIDSDLLRLLMWRVNGWWLVSLVLCVLYGVLTVGVACRLSPTNIFTSVFNCKQLGGGTYIIYLDHLLQNQSLIERGYRHTVCIGTSPRRLGGGTAIWFAFLGHWAESGQLFCRVIFLDGERSLHGKETCIPT